MDSKPLRVEMRVNLRKMTVIFVNYAKTEGIACTHFTEQLRREISEHCCFCSGSSEANCQAKSVPPAQPALDRSDFICIIYTWRQTWKYVQPSLTLSQRTAFNFYSKDVSHISISQVEKKLATPPPLRPSTLSWLWYSRAKASIDEVHQPGIMCLILIERCRLPQHYVSLLSTELKKKSCKPIYIMKKCVGC